MQLGNFLEQVTKQLSLNDYNVKEFLNEESGERIPTFLEGTDMEIIQCSGDQYQCAVYSRFESGRIYDQVDIYVNGKTYTKKPDDEGLYKLTINLGVGEYEVVVSFKGNEKYEPSTCTNKIIVKPKDNKKQIILGCDANTDQDSTIQKYIAQRLEQEGYPVEKLAIEPNAFASYDWSGKARGKIGVYLIASGLFSIADAWENQAGFDNYIFAIRGDFGDRGATNFDISIRRDADCTSICDQFANKTFNQINALVQPKIAVVGGESTERLADNMIDWLRALENREPEKEEEKTYSQTILEHFESKFGKMTCIDDCLAAIQTKGYAYYYDDAYTNQTSINRMANGSGVNCTDACHVFWHLAVALGYRVEVLHIQCSGGDGHVRLELEKESTETGTFYRDPAAVLDGEAINYNWCTNGYTIAVNPDWFFENLYR